MVHAGERLSEERIKKGLTLEDVSKATKIRLSFLTYIEKGEYKKLPLGTYAHGFVRNYAKFLGLPEHELLALFKREYDEDKFVKVLPDGFARKDDFPLKRIKFAHTLKVIILILIVLAAYIIFQYRAAIFNPSLSVSKPKDGEIIKTQEITVMGKTDLNSTVFINNETASLDKDGNFTKKVNVFPGKARITIKAVNNFSKTTTVDRYIEVKSN
ncbi:MAG: helix-turn-helix domain-containing protein [Candidatus Levybacteria bacterium]|nr:helix-turn-helix domain-containing protein [Candidatus Levybacteria bacterium]